MDLINFVRQIIAQIQALVASKNDAISTLKAENLSLKEQIVALNEQLAASMGNSTDLAAQLAEAIQQRDNATAEYNQYLEADSNEDNEVQALLTSLIETISASDSSETPVDETPVDEAPVDEAPVDEAPVDEAPVDEAPVDEAPVDETPTDETPTDETPTDEIQ